MHRSWSSQKSAKRHVNLIDKIHVTSTSDKVSTLTVEEDEFGLEIQ